MQDIKDTQSDVSATSPMSAPEVEEDPKAVKYLEHLLKEGAEEEDDGRDLELPPWYNEELFKRGQGFIGRYRFMLFFGWLCGLIATLSLPSAFEVLICTGQSSTPATAYRRYVRTIYHTFAWYRYPAEKDSKFFESIQMVRKGHLRASRTCTRQIGRKINQRDMAIAQFGFVGFITLITHRIGLYDREYLEATVHVWRVIGYLLGIKDEYNLCGENWEETRPRLEIVQRKILQPALDNAPSQFYKMTQALIEGLHPVNLFLTTGSFIFFTKRLAYCKGYELYDADFPNGVRIPNQKQYIDDLGWWDCGLVKHAVFMITVMYKYTIFRWYMNFIQVFLYFFMYYFPLLASVKYGVRWSYVRIFSSSKGMHEEHAE